MRHAEGRGFTLVELIITVALLAIISAVAAVFIVGPVQAYFATQGRAELTDVADTALRRLARDVRSALPNSVRTTVSGGVTYLELLATRTGGRYRAEPDDGTSAGEDPLDFAAADSVFDTIGRLSTAAGQTVAAGDLVVIHNLGISGASAYSGDNTGVVQTFAANGGGAGNEDRITLNPAKLFPLESPGRRFQVVSGPVTYECAPGAAVNGDGTGQLRRVSGYAINAAQPTGAYGGAPVRVLANFVTACSLEYTLLPLQARGLVAIRLELTRAGETIFIYQEAHVSNVP
jgi:MSHA biogenesis protein MshO